MPRPEGSRLGGLRLLGLRLLGLRSGLETWLWPGGSRQRHGSRW